MNWESQAPGRDPGVLSAKSVAGSWVRPGQVDLAGGPRLAKGVCFPDPAGSTLARRRLFLGRRPWSDTPYVICIQVGIL